MAGSRALPSLPAARLSPRSRASDRFSCPKPAKPKRRARRSIVDRLVSDWMATCGAVTKPRSASGMDSRYAMMRWSARDIGIEARRPRSVPPLSWLGRSSLETSCVTRDDTTSSIGSQTALVLVRNVSTFDARVNPQIPCARGEGRSRAHDRMGRDELSAALRGRLPRRSRGQCDAWARRRGLGAGTPARDRHAAERPYRVALAEPRPDTDLHLKARAGSTPSSGCSRSTTRSLRPSPGGASGPG